MSFILCSNWLGRFGNRMYQYAYEYTYSNMHKIDMMLPSEWEGSVLFKKKPYKIVNKLILEKLSNTHGIRNDIDERLDILKIYHPNIKIVKPNSINAYDYNGDPVVFSSGCFYNETIFQSMNKKNIKELFEFSDEVKNSKSYKYWSEKKGTYDVAHIRRDDVSSPSFNKNNIQWYSTISIASYEKAFNKFNFKKENINFVSDDYLKKWHTNRPDAKKLGWTYPEGSEYSEDIIFDWLDDFLKMYFARTIFRANSSFSWWAGFLSPCAKVYSPVITESKIYGKNNIFEEIDVEFVEGNSPHWFYEPDVYFSNSGLREILIND